jgi:glycosyltransferase involved in cell wall biosynthesis
MSFRENPGLSVIVPVYNERYLVLESLKRLDLLPGSGVFSRVQVIVVDDGSSDGTTALLKQHQEKLQAAGWNGLEWVFLFHGTNRGKGSSIRTAMEHVDTDLVVIHDADLEYHPRDLLKMIPLFREENADAVFGSRFLSGGFKRALFFRHTLGNKLITLLCNLVTDLNLTDIETCYKMVRADLLKSIPLESNRFGIEPEMTIKLAKRNARIFEVPITYSGRTYVEGKKIGWKDGVQALWAMLKFAISDRIYNSDANGSEILARLQRAPKFTRWMADTIKPYIGNRVLEIGAGIGNLTLNLVPRVEYWATDIEPHYLERLEKLSLDRPYLRVCFTDGTAVETFPAGQQFDTVICLNVVEHLENDVAALRNIRESLEAGGRAIILVPNGKALYGTLDRVLGHHRRYTREELAGVAQKAGLEIEEIFGFNRFGSPAWLLNGRILNRETFGFWQIQVLNFVVPLVRRIDRWLPFPPLSLIAILRAPGGKQPTQAEIVLDFSEKQTSSKSGDGYLHVTPGT